MRDAQAPDVHRNDVRHLVEEGLIDRKTAIVNHQPTHLLVLTQEGKALLDDARDAGGSDRQQYHSGLVKPRELAHDVQIYRAYQVERERIESDGGQVRRVSLDYELKRDYQAYLNRQDKPDGVSFDDEMEAFAAAHHLPVIDGHLELPDLRIEYETADVVGSEGGATPLTLIRRASLPLCVASRHRARCVEPGQPEGRS
jgi:hypothetical protein